MHTKIVKSILSAHNGMNIYRGCSHGCIYCDSRSKCYQINHLFEDIEVKENATILLEQALIRKKTKCMIGTGSMTDPYIHLEKKLENTRKCLELIYKYGFGLSIQTKSNLILRDIELLKKINERTKCVVSITMTTYDDELVKLIEPNVSSTKERFEVLKILRDNNIPTIIWLTPILPFINDNLENIKGIIEYAKEANVYGIICFNMGLTLREGNREYFYKELDKKFPGLKEKYIKKYGNSYEVISPKNYELMNYFYNECKKNNIETDYNKIFKYMNTLETKKEQLSLFD